MGKVYLVGAGPGAADLLTLRAIRLLNRANIVFFDDLVHADILNMAPQAQKIPVGKRAGRVSTEQAFISKQLVEAARRFACVVRLKGGDPLLFGRADEELQALHEANIEVEVVPGISAAFSAAADLQVSLTQRGISRHVTFLTPRIGKREQSSDWLQPAIFSDTVALYMAAGTAIEVAEALLSAGRTPNTPVVIVENASLPYTRRWSMTLSELARLDAGSLPWGNQGPSILLMGEVFQSTLEAKTAITPPKSLSSPNIPARHGAGR